VDALSRRRGEKYLIIFSGRRAISLRAAVKLADLKDNIKKAEKK
jgi:hypothetical protein